MHTLIIDRGQLLTGAALRTLFGQTEPNGVLRHAKSGLMDALGHYGKALGVSLKRLSGVSELSELDCTGPDGWLARNLSAKDRQLFPEADSLSRLSVETGILWTNDDQLLHPSRREGRIARLFKTYGNVDVTFVGSYRESTQRAKQAAEQLAAAA